MENMNWTTLIVGAIIGAVFGIPFAYLTNLTTPNLQSWFKKQSMSNKSWELQSIKKEYEIAKRYKENPELLTQNIIFRTGVIGVFFFFTLGVSSGLFMLVVMDYKNTIMQLLFEESVTRDLEIEILGGLILFFATIWLILLGIVLLFMLLDFRREKQHIESFAEYEKEALKKIEELENIVLKQ